MAKELIFFCEKSSNYGIINEELTQYCLGGYHMLEQLTRITHNSDVMGGKPCIAGTRITVGMILMQISEGVTINELLMEYPHLTEDDVAEALRYAAWVVGTKEELVFSA
jgi:uncharacterized protein (DUF433 family)